MKIVHFLFYSICQGFIKKCETLVNNIKMNTLNDLDKSTSIINYLKEDELNNICGGFKFLSKSLFFCGSVVFWIRR